MSVQRKYLDFEVKIDDLGGERYRATVIDMPLGEGQAQVSNDFALPFSADDLNRILAVVGGRLDVSNAERQRQARIFGETLFKAVFAGPVYTVYFSSRDHAQMADGLRVKLFLENAGSIANLPWELLRDPGVDFLALSRSTPLIRHPRSLVIRSRPVFSLPLRVLVMISSPSDLEPLDAKTEWENLQAATATLREQNLLELELLEDASLRTLQRMMRTREYHVFHYIGHSTFDPVTGQGMLALEDPFGEGSSFPVRGEDLARELGEENTIRLVVMNSCQSAVDLEGDPFAGIASSLVARGIPAVVAMQNVISEQAARVFSDELYRAVAEGLPVDAGVAEARRAINNVVGGIEWATPVLFMRAADGMLFDFGRKKEPVTATFRKPAVLAGIGGALLLVVLLIAGLLVFDGGGNGTPTPIPVMDLAVDSVEVFPSRPAPGEKAGVFVAISNQSGAPVGAFGYDFRQDVLDQDVNLTGMINGLAPGDMVTVLIPHYFTWWGAFVSEVRVDVGSDVPETDEFNNISRYPVVTSNDPFTVLFDVLPSGKAITESMPLDDSTFATWNFRLEAVGGAGCENAVPWIIVDGDNRYVGTGRPDSPDSCTNADLVILFDNDRTVSGVMVQFEPVQLAEYSLVALNGEGIEIDRVAETFADGPHELDVFGGMGNRQDMAEIVFASGGAPARILQFQLTEPAQLGLKR